MSIHGIVALRWFAEVVSIEGTVTRPATAIAMLGAALLITPWTAPAVGADPSTDFPVDGHGYVNTAAHCDDGQTVMMFGRTARALVAVCVGPDGQLQYRGVRISDRSGLVMGAARGADGAVIATNDDVTYAVSETALLVSAGDTVLYRDTWEEFHQPSTPTTSASSSAPSTTAAPGPAATSTPTASIPTVSTTTVTPPPRKPSGN